MNHLSHKVASRELILAQVTDFPNIDKDTFKDSPISPNMIIMGALLLIWAWIYLSDSNSSKNKLATACWGGSKQYQGAKKKGEKQIAKPSRNRVTLYVNKPKSVRAKQLEIWKKRGFTPPLDVKPNSTKTYYIPDCQRGTAIIGAAGSGKTYSCADPMLRSMADQGFPILLYDFKYPEQTSRIAAYAAARGYTIKVFAPGFKESCTINPLQFIHDEEDSVRAGQMAKVVNKNMSDGNSKGGDKFFETAGDALVEGIFLLTKAIPKLLAKWRPQEYARADGVTPNKVANSYDDLITAQQLLSLPDIAKRLVAAKEAGTIGNWTSIPLTQVMQSADSEKTVSGIVATALTTFTLFLKKSFIPSFVGETDMDLDVDGKQLVVFGLDQNNRDIVSPLLATLLHMVIDRNLTRAVKRSDPLCCMLDEIPTMFLPKLVNWLAEYREAGFVGILGLQNVGQLEKRYGKETAQIILGNCSTKFIFNPQENQSAEMFSKLIGDTEITYTTKSRSSSKGGGSRSTNKNKQARPLMPPYEFNQLGQGRCILLNPNYKKGKRSYIPMLQDILVSPHDDKEQEWSVAQWPVLKQRLIDLRKSKLGNSNDLDRILDHAIEERCSIAKGFFPAPEKAAA